MANSIGVLWDVKGGATLNGESGQRISAQLTSLANKISNSNNRPKIVFGIDEAKTKSLIQRQLNNITQGLNLPIGLGGSGGSGGKSPSNNNSIFTDPAVKTRIESATNKTLAYAKAQGIAQTAQDKLTSAYNAFVANPNTDTAKKLSLETSALRAMSAEKRQAVQSATNYDNVVKKLNTTLKSGQDYYNTYSSSISKNAELNSKWQKYLNDAENGMYENTERGAAQSARRLSELQAETRRTGSEVITLGDKFKNLFNQHIATAITMFGIHALQQGLREIYDNVVEIDTAMTELRKVTDETNSTYSDFLDSTCDKAKELGSTVSDLVNATADFARLGYGLEDASNLANVATVYKNVGDGITDISTASESIISTMKAFGIESSKAISIVDKFNEVGNRYAVSSSGVGEILKRSASAMASANNTLDETISLGTAANEIIQDPEKVGTSLKVISMYLRSAKSEAEEAGESTDGMVESVSKLRDELKNLTGGKVDILEADGQTYKSTYQILKELSSVTNSLSDVSQANILEMIGGKRNANITSAILSNFSTAEKVLATASDSAGSAMKENDKYLDSINGRISQLQATFQELSTSVLNSGLIKGGVSFLTGILFVLNSILSFGDGAIPKITLIAIALSSVYLLGGKLIPLIKNIAAAFSIAKVEAAGFSGVLELLNLNPTMLAITALSVALYGIYEAYKYVSEETERYSTQLSNLSQEINDIKSNINSLNSELQTTQDRISELQKLKDLGTITPTEETELDRLQRTNAELERKIALEKADQEIKSKDAQQKFIDTVESEFSSKKNLYSTSKSTGDFWGTIKNYSLRTMTTGVTEEEIIEDQFNQLEKLKDDLANASTKKEQKRIEEKINNTEQFLSDENQKVSGYIKSLEDSGYIYGTNKDVDKYIDKIKSFQDHYLTSLNSMVSSSESSIKSGESEKATVESLTDSYSSLKEEVSSLSSAYESMNDKGELSVEQVFNLIEKYPDLINSIYQENGAYKISVNALKEKFDAIKKAKMAQIDASRASVTAQLEEAKTTLALAEIKKQTASKDAQMRINYGERSTKDDISNLEAQLQKLNLQYNAFDSLKLDSFNKSSSSSSKTAGDLALENWQKVSKEWKHQLDMNQISDRQYYDILSANYRNYLKNYEETSDEIKSVQEELYKHFKDLYKEDLEKQKESLNAQKESLSEKLSNLKDFYDKQKDLLQDKADSENEEEKRQEYAKDISKIELLIQELSKDTTAQKELAEAKQQLADKNKEYQDWEKENALNNQLDLLDKYYANDEASINSQIDGIDNQVKNIDSTISNVDKGIGNIYGLVKSWASAQGYNVSGFATGTASSPSGLFRTQELGTEAIGMNLGSGNFTYLTGGSNVLNAKATERLYSFTNNPLKFLSQYASQLKSSIGSSSLQPVAISMGDIIVQGNADSSTLSALHKEEDRLTNIMLNKLKKLNR